MVYNRANGKFQFKDLAVLVENWLTAWKIPPLPGPASNPNPADGTTFIDINADLSWTAGADAESYDVYFGTGEPPPFMGNQTATTFDPGTLSEASKYYWRIDSINEWGQTDGQVWVFFTSIPPPPPPPT